MQLQSLIIPKKIFMCEMILNRMLISGEGVFREDVDHLPVQNYVHKQIERIFAVAAAILTTLGRTPTGSYPLARNQYINSSPGIFSCIRAGANTCAHVFAPKLISPKCFYVLASGMREYSHCIHTDRRGKGGNTCLRRCEYIFQK